MEIVDYRNSKDALKKLEEHRPYKAFDVFFSMENHWLSSYTDLPTDICPYGILESYDGTLLAIIDINCGYGGVGPHYTASLLTWLGVAPETAEDWIYAPGIHIEFSKAGEWIPQSLRLSAYFSDRETDKPQVLLGDRIFSKQDMRTIYFVNPQYGNYRYLHNALRFCKPTEFTYYCGENASNHISYHTIFQYQFIRDATHRAQINGGFIRIHGMQYDVVCFSDRASIHSLIQNLYCFYFGKGLFYEHSIGELVVFTDKPIDDRFKSKLGLIKSILFQHSPKERYASKLIPVALMEAPAEGWTKDDK